MRKRQIAIKNNLAGGFIYRGMVIENNYVGFRHETGGHKNVPAGRGVKKKASI